MEKRAFTLYLKNYFSLIQKLINSNFLTVIKEVLTMLHTVNGSVHMRTSAAANIPRCRR